VEIHSSSAERTYFKWSRENSSVFFPIEKIAGKTLTLAHLGRDAQLGLAVLDWVEISSPATDLAAVPAPALYQVEGIDPEARTVTLKLGPGQDVPQNVSRALLRRWDQRSSEDNGCVEAAIVGPDGEPRWHELEDGIEVQFTRESEGEEPSFKAGDFWLIPARVATGTIEWPEAADGKPEKVPPQGIVRHYAPLGAVKGTGTGAFEVKTHWRRTPSEV
jgi:hypothetical protein